MAKESKSQIFHRINPNGVKHGASPVATVEGAVASIDSVCEAAKKQIIAAVVAHAQAHPDNPWSGAQLVNLERTIKALYASWGQDIKGTFKKSLPKVMQEFVDKAKAEMKTAGREQHILGKPDTQRVQWHLNSSFDQVAMRTDKMAFDHIAQLRRISAEVIRTASLTGQTRKEVSSQLLNRAITEIPGFKFIDNAGRHWKDKSYFEMLARTELMNAGRASYDDTCAKNGFDVVQLTFSGHSCKACTRWEGRLFSLTGATPGLPTKDDLLDAGVFHPNCTHSYTAVSDYDRETMFDEKGNPLSAEEAEERREKATQDDIDWLENFDRKHQADKKAAAENGGQDAEAQAQAKAEAEAKAKAEEAARAKVEAEARAKEEAAAKAAAEARAKEEAEAKARAEEAAKQAAQASEAARKAEEQAKKAEEAARKAAEEAARLEKERVAKEEAEHQQESSSQDVKTASEQRLEQIPGVEKVDFDGWKDEDGIKTVTDQMERLADEYNGQPPFSRFTVQEIIDDRTGTVSDKIGGVTINGDNSPNGIKGQVSLNIRVLERIPELRAKLDTDADGRYIGLGCFMLKGREAECLATHEFGHRILGEFYRRGDLQKVANYIEMVFKQHTKGFGVGADAIDVRSEVSKYAASSWQEFWSECFSIYKCGDKSRLPRDIQYMVSNVLVTIRKENPIEISKLDDAIKIFRKEYKAIRNQHADISRFGESRVIVDTEGRVIEHNEIPRIDGPLPDDKREKAEDHPEKIHDDKSDASEDVKKEQREKCLRDIEKLQPGLAEEAQRVYDMMNATEKDVIHAYTMRDLYSINSKMLWMYLANDKHPEQTHQLSSFLDERDRRETERRLRVLEQLPKFSGTVYRGMGFETDEKVNQFTKKWRRGLSPLTGFISTTYVKGNEGLYIDKAIKKVILIVHDTSKGSYIGHLSSTPADEEVLFSCNQKFRLMTKDELGREPIETKDGITYINIKER